MSRRLDNLGTVIFAVILISIISLAGYFGFVAFFIQNQCDGDPNSNVIMNFDLMDDSYNQSLSDINYTVTLLETELTPYSLVSTIEDAGITQLSINNSQYINIAADKPLEVTYDLPFLDVAEKIPQLNSSSILISSQLPFEFSIKINERAAPCACFNYYVFSSKFIDFQSGTTEGTILMRTNQICIDA